MTIAEKDYDVTALEQAASLVSGTATSKYEGLTKVISVRLPLHMICSVEAYARNGSVSRNSMISTLISVATEQISAKLEPKVLKSVNRLADEIFNEQIGSDELESGVL